MKTKYQHESHVDYVADTTAHARPRDLEVPPKTASDELIITSFRVLFAHITWFFVAPLALLLMLFGIVSAETGWATGLDAAFFVLVGLAGWCRWYDQRSGQATNCYGEPATSADCRRYLIWMPAIAVLAWIVANVIGNHF